LKATSALGADDPHRRNYTSELYEMNMWQTGKAEAAVDVIITPESG
jgi:hypothetical protein